MKKSLIEFYTRLAKGIAAEFGPNCEVVIHDLQDGDHEHSIIAIENGHVTGRQVGDGPSHIVLEALQHSTEWQHDRLAYLTKTRDGKILKSSTIYIRDDSNRIIGIFGINYDITLMLAMSEQLKSFTGTSETNEEAPVALNVADLLDELIDQSIRQVGKPVPLMKKEDKVQVIRLLNEAGAFLITKSGPKVCKHLGISKYTLYSYLDEVKADS
ncbi:MAG: helix-turn-helix transcriptional regulator [Eubacterium sp.]|jgi:predicted transcriptional regulator YheO